MQPRPRVAYASRVVRHGARMHFLRQERIPELKIFRQVLPVAQELGDEELAGDSLGEPLEVFLPRAEQAAARQRERFAKDDSGLCQTR